VKSEQAHDPLRLVLLSALLAMSEATVLVTGAGAQMLSPLQSERRVVVVVKGSSRSLTLSEPMVWLDAGPREPPTRGVRLPAGQYALEAEDTNFLYYRSPEPIEYRIFQNGQVTSTRFMPGGIYLSKAAVAFVPAGVYMSTDETHKTLTWKLGATFLQSEGKTWKRSE
jgi:hypothetical protein